MLINSQSNQCYKDVYIETALKNEKNITTKWIIYV